MRLPSACFLDNCLWVGACSMSWCRCYPGGYVLCVELGCTRSLFTTLRPKMPGKKTNQPEHLSRFKNVKRQWHHQTTMSSAKNVKHIQELTQSMTASQAVRVRSCTFSSVHIHSSLYRTSDAPFARVLLVYVPIGASWCDIVDRPTNNCCTFYPMKMQQVSHAKNLV